MIDNSVRIAYKSDDGVSIIMPTPEFCACKENDLAKLVERSVPEGCEYEVLGVADIPVDRYFRNAWKLGQGIEIDRPRAEKIHMDYLRYIRNEKLKAEDIEYQKALEMHDDALMNAVANRKKKLRDMPANTDLSNMPLDELKSYVPDVLKEGV